MTARSSAGATSWLAIALVIACDRGATSDGATQDASKATIDAPPPAVSPPAHDETVDAKRTPPTGVASAVCSGWCGRLCQESTISPVPGSDPRSNATSRTFFCTATAANRLIKKPIA